MTNREFIDKLTDMNKEKDILIYNEYNEEMEIEDIFINSNKKVIVALKKKGCDYCG